jgi:uncharacterized protein (TIGR03437 family)
VLLKKTISGYLLAAVTCLVTSSTGTLLAQNQLQVDKTSLDFYYQVGSSVQPSDQPVNILTTGASVPITFDQPTYQSSPGGWLVVNPTNGTNTPATLNLHVNTTGLNVGDYKASFNISATGVSNSPLNIQVTLHVSNTSQLVVSPNPLNLTATIGSPAQSSTLSVTSLGSPLSFTTTSAVTSPAGGTWLKVSPASGTTGPGGVTVTADPTGLAQGTYAGTVTITSLTAGNSPVVVPVNLVVQAVPQITASQSSLSYVYQVGSALPLSQTVQISTNGNTQVPFTATANPGPTIGWLKVNGALTATGTTPTPIIISVDITSLAAGTYTGSVSVTGSGFLAATIPVTLTISTKPLISVTPLNLTFAAQAGGIPPSTQNVSISTTGPTLGYTVASSQPWIFAGVTSNNATLAPANFFVGVNQNGLAAGTYTGTLTVTANGADNSPQTINITLTVSPAITLNLTQNGQGLVTPLAFTATAGGTVPTAQVFNIAASDGSAQNLTLTATTNDHGAWLFVIPSTAKTPATNVQVAINPAAVTPSTTPYQGTITIAGANNGVTPVNIPVSFLLTATNAVTANPAQLTFTQGSGGSAPAAQNIQLTGSPAALGFAAFVTSNTPWLTITPSQGTTPATLSVSVNGSTLSPGQYTGNVRVQSTAPTPLDIPVTLNVTSGAQIALSPTALTFAYQPGGTVPAALPIAVSSTTAGVTFSVTPSTATGGSWLTASVSTGTVPATVNVGVTPTGLATGTYTGTVTFNGTGAFAGATATVNVTLTVSVLGAPNLTTFLNGASFTPGGAAPGMIVTLGGTNLGPTTGVAGTITNGLFDTTLSNVKVTFDGTPAPLLYVSNNQINAIAPYSLAGRTNTSVAVQYQGQTSNAIVLRVDNAGPAIFALDATGKGPGAILNQDSSINKATNPATKGQVIVLYATGEGQTNPIGTDGKIIGTDLHHPVLPVSVRIGGIDAPVQYAGSAPTLVSGALQVNVVVPATAPSGSAVPVDLQVGTFISPAGAITVAIR